LRPIKFHNINEKPDIQLGVSNKFKNEELKKQVQEILNAPNKPVKEEPMIDITSTLENIAGKSGAYARIPREKLIATPEEWNKFTPISNDKKVLMAESIYSNGLLQPIVVRAISEDNTHFQILAGNTRNELFGILYDLTKDEKYLAIDAKVYWYGELSDEQAKEIVTDTNYIQRANLTARDRVFCIHNKIQMLKARKEKSIIDKVAVQLDLKRTTVFYWNKLTNLIPEFFDLFQADALSLVAASRLASFPQGVQRELYNMRDALTNELILKVPAKTKPEEIVPLFKSLLTEKETPKVSYKLDATWEEGNSFFMKATSKPPEGTKPFMIYIPENKLKVFLKTYEDFIVK